MENKDGTVLMSHECKAGDIWRMSRTKDIPIKDWVKLNGVKLSKTNPMYKTSSYLETIGHKYGLVLLSIL